MERVGRLLSTDEVLGSAGRSRCPAGCKACLLLLGDGWRGKMTPEVPGWAQKWHSHGGVVLWWREMLRSEAVEKLGE